MIPFNPCGAVCDYGRRPYSTECKFFSDSDELNTIEWYPAAPDAEHLKHRSAFMSRDWTDDFYALDGVGEVYGETRNFNARKVIDNALGTHNCGEDNWFAEGVPYDPEREPVEYDEETGLPTCCDVEKIPGGLVANGSAPFRYLPYYYPRGGLLADGNSPYSGPYIWFTTGGILANGTAPIVAPYIWFTTGGIVANGEAPFTYSPFFTPTGGALADGEAPYDFSVVVTPTGGALADGEAPYDFSVVVTPTGGALADGTSPGSISWAYTPTGGALADGTADLTIDWEVIPEGGIVANGTAPSVYTPPGSSPASNTCATAYASTISIGYPGTLVTGDVHWRIWASAPGVPRLVTTVLSSGTLTGTIWRGTSCGTLTFVYAGALPFSQMVTPTAGQSIYVTIAPTGSGGSYTVAVT